MLPIRKLPALSVYILLAFVASACLLSTAQAQFVQQGGKLIGTGAEEWAAQGWSVAISADGNTAIVGGWHDNSGSGAAWMYTRTGGVWSQQGGKLTDTNAVGRASQGYSVALSADGNTAIVGGNDDNGSIGAAWVYTRAGGAWSQQGGKLVGTGAVGSSTQGSSVALSADGNTALVGATGDNGGIGATWVYTRTGGVWSQQGAKLTGTSAVGTAGQGASVALSNDGNTAIAGGTGDTGAVGAMWVYTRTGGVWSQQGGKLTGTGAVGSSEQGTSVALSADGNTALVGAPEDNHEAGAAWIYTRTGGVWSQQGAKLAGTGAVGDAAQGISVALSGDGNTAIVGGPWDDDNFGALWVYTRSGGVWTQQGDKLIGTGEKPSAYQAWSVALSADGSTAIEGGFYDDGGIGAAWVFTKGSSGPSDPPSIAAGGVLNGASFLPGIAPGAWISIFGSNLSGTTRMWNDSDFVGNNLPARLDGVSVTVNGYPAYVYYISPAQLNILVPASAWQGLVEVQVTNHQGKNIAVNASQGPYSPGLFTYSRQGVSYVAGVRADNASLADVAAKPGDIIVLFGTGFGATNPATPIGQIVSAAPLVNPVTVWIGGVAIVPQFAGIVGAGLYQFNVVVPNVPDGDNAVLMQIGGSATQPNAFLTVQR